jgi:hypothetical protein
VLYTNRLEPDPTSVNCCRRLLTLNQNTDVKISTAVLVSSMQNKLFLARPWGTKEHEERCGSVTQITHASARVITL